MTIIGFCGFDGGKLKELSHYTAHVNFPSYTVCEDIHSMFGSYLTSYLREEFF